MGIETITLFDWYKSGVYMLLNFEDLKMETNFVCVFPHFQL